MNKKILLTSFIALGFACPAMAISTLGWPSNNLMQEDMIYVQAATSEHMDGVTNGDVYAEAEYIIPASGGKYLPANSETPQTCNIGDSGGTTGYYCPGSAYYTGINNGEGFSFSATETQGRELCPTGLHGSTGASAITDCKRDCVAGDIAHAATVSGKVKGKFINSGEKGYDLSECQVTTCETGYTKLGNSCVVTTITIHSNNVETVGTVGDWGPLSSDGTVNSAVNYGGSIHTPYKAKTITGKKFNGWRFTSSPTSGNL